MTKHHSGGSDDINEAADKLFAKKQEIIDFNFGADTAAVFDDMLDRSVPLYQELQRMMGEIAGDFAKPDTNVYDLGCSTGNTLYNISPFMPEGVDFIGIDYSDDMLAKFKEKLAKKPLKGPVQLICEDLNNTILVQNASVVILNLTLQFVRPIYRDKLIRGIYEGLLPGGALILVEKVLGNDSVFNRIFIKYYYDMKRRNGYSGLEIAQKREALENVLIPYSLEENQELLTRNGFAYLDIFYKWYNFCGLVALK